MENTNDEKIKLIEEMLTNINDTELIDVVFYFVRNFKSTNQ